MLLQQGVQPSKDLFPTTVNEEENTLIVHDHGESVLLDKFDIVHAMADGAYTQLFLRDGRYYVVSKNLKTISKTLNDNCFIRTHKSHLVNYNYVAKFVKHDGGYLVLQNNDTVPVSVRRKSDIANFMRTVID